jgi:uncharacterized protein YoxC
MERDLLLLYIMAGFTGIAAVALVIQMAMLIGIFRSVKTLQERAEKFMDSFEPLAETSRQTLDEVRKQSTEILTRVREMADSTKSQVDKVEDVITDLSASARTQMERVDKTVEFLLRRLEETVAAVQRTVLMPVRQARGVAAAAGAVIDHLATGRRRSTVDRATLDEEMFI